MKLLLGLFIIAHGLLHASYLTPKPADPNYPFSFTKGWFPDLVGAVASKPFGVALAVATVVLLVLAGLAILGVPGLASLTKLFVIAGSAASLLLLVLFWHPWLLLGVLINLVLLYGALQLGWFGK